MRERRYRSAFPSLPSVPLSISPIADGVRVTVHVQPRARRPGVRGLHGDALKVHVAAPPVDGAANAAVIETLAEHFGIAPRAVTIIAGHGARRKLVELLGVTAEAVSAAAGT